MTPKDNDTLEAFEASCSSTQEVTYILDGQEFTTLRQLLGRVFSAGRNRTRNDDWIDRAPIHKRTYTTTTHVTRTSTTEEL